MTCAIIRRFALFQISGFFQSGNLLAQHLGANQCAGLMNSFRARCSRSFYQHNLSDFGQFCQNPEHALSHRPTRSTNRCVPRTSNEVRPRKDHRGFAPISDALPFGRLWYGKVDDAIGYATFFSRSNDAVIRVYDQSGNVVEPHEHTGDFNSGGLLLP